MADDTPNRKLLIPGSPSDVIAGTVLEARELRYDLELGRAHLGNGKTLGGLILGSDADVSEQVQRAEAASQRAEAARDAAVASGHLFPTKEEGLAGTDANGYFLVADSNTGLNLFRKEGGAAVLKVTFPTTAGMALYGTVPPVVAGVQENQAAAINAALADPTVLSVILPPGVIWVDETIVVPASKKLLLQSTTVLRAMPSFRFVNQRNHVVLLAGSRAQIHGGTVDMNKVGLGEGSNRRCNGVTVLDGARDCVRNDVVVMNCTGYGVYDAGADNHQNMPSSHNNNVRTFNCQVHFEQQASDGSYYVDCHARDGDGDIPCLSMWHPVAGPRNITAIGCSGVGLTPAVWEVTANIQPIDNIEIIGGRYVQTNEGGSCFVVTAGIPNRVTGLRMSGAAFVSPKGYAMQLSNTKARLSNCDLAGAYGFQNVTSDVLAEGCEIVLSDSAGSQRALVGIINTDAQSKVRFNGGRIEIKQGMGSTESKSSDGPNIVISSTTDLIPPPPGGMILRQDKLSSADVIADGDHAYANIFDTFTNRDKVRIEVFDFPDPAAAYGKAKPTFTLNPIESGFQRILITNGASLGDKKIVYRYIELP